MKLNLGCGNHPIEGFINVDKFQNSDNTVDILLDLEQKLDGKIHWPWDTNSVSEIKAHHILEHLGDTAEDFCQIMQEMYRLCKADAKIEIRVPYAFSDAQVADPTHKRAITPTTLSLFDKQKNLYWKESGAPNSPLGLYYDVDFVLIDTEGVAFSDVDQVKVNQYNFYTNTLAEWKMLLGVRK